MRVLAARPCMSWWCSHGAAPNGLVTRRLGSVDVGARTLVACPLPRQQAELLTTCPARRGTMHESGRGGHATWGAGLCGACTQGAHTQRWTRARGPRAVAACAGTVSACLRARTNRWRRPRALLISAAAPAASACRATTACVCGVDHVSGRMQSKQAWITGYIELVSMDRFDPRACMHEG
jgi:hypothetical protein